MKTFLLLLFIAMTVVSGCTSMASLMRNNEPEAVLLPYKLIDVEVKDNRSNISERPIDLPLLSFPGQHDNVSPVLSQTLEDSIKQQVRSYSIAQMPQKVTARITILKVEQGFEATMFSEVESADCEVRIELIDENNKLLHQSTGEFSYQSSSMDATHKHINALYRTVLHIAIYRACAGLVKNITPK